MKWQPFFNFFHNGWHWYSINTQRTGDTNFQFSKFSVDSVFPITHSRFHFNINAWLRLKHLCMDIYEWWPFCTQKIGDIIFPLIQLSKFSVGWVFPVTHLRFCFNIYAWLHLKHLCIDIYAWWPFCTSKSAKKICQNRLFESPIISVTHNWIVPVLRSTDYMRGNGLEDIQPSPWQRALRCAAMTLAERLAGIIQINQRNIKGDTPRFGFGNYGKFAGVKSNDDNHCCWVYDVFLFTFCSRCCVKGHVMQHVVMKLSLKKRAQIVKHHHHHHLYVQQ